jgi:hypothetical protein
LVAKVDIFVEPGGEGYVKWARARLRALGTTRADLGVPSLQKHWAPASGTLISLLSSEWGDRIRIFNDAGGHGFVATLFARKLNPTVAKTFTSSRQPAFLPFSKTAWEPLGIAGATFTTGQPSVIDNTTRTPHSGGSSYVQNRVNTAFGSSGATIFALGVFPHTYEVSGQTRTELLEISTSGVFYNVVSGVRTALTATDAPPFETLDGFTVSENGRTLVAHALGTNIWYQAAIDFALGTPVAWTVIPEPTPYGSQTTTSSTTGQVGDGDTGVPNLKTVSSLTVMSATYPFVRGVDASGTAKTIYGMQEQSASRVKISNLTPTGGVGIGFAAHNGSQALEQHDSLSLTYTLPDGNTKTFLLSTEDISGSGQQVVSYDGSQHLESHSGSLTRTALTGAVTVLFADPAQSILIYEYEWTTNESVNIVNAELGMFFEQMNADNLMSTHRRVGILVEGRDVLIEQIDDEPILQEDAGGTNVYSFNDAIFVAPASGEETVDVVDPFGGDSSGIIAPRKSYGSNEYFSTAKDAARWMVSVTRTDFPVSDEVGYFRLYKGRRVQGQITSTDVTTAYLTYLSESLPIIGGPDEAAIAFAQLIIAAVDSILNDPVQLQAFADSAFGGDVGAATTFLNDLRAAQQEVLATEQAKPPGTADPDAALLLSNPTLFEIRASALTYV